MLCILETFQKEIVDYVGEEVLKSGLLIGQEKRHEEETEMFSFLHVLIQQFFAAKYVATVDQVICDS